MGPYRYFHFLSLDIVLGAAASGYFASRILDAHMHAGWWLALCLSVWLLYLVDHWFDSRRHGVSSWRPVHLFFRKNSKWLLILILIIALTDIPVVFFLLEKKLVMPGLVIGGVTLILYLFRHVSILKRRAVLPLEFFIMIFYTAGIWFGPFLMSGKEPEWSSILIILQFSLMILVNITVLSFYDYELDKSLDNISLAILIGRKDAKILALTLTVAASLITVAVFLLSGESTVVAGSLLLCLMTVITFLLVLFPSGLRKNEKYRMAADAILYLGWIIGLI